jgi:hypothetical protein
MEYLGVIFLACLLISGIGAFAYVFIMLGNIKYDYKYLVGTIAVAVFCFSLSFFYIYSGQKKNLNPPYMNSCPDFWEIQKDGTCKIPGSINMGDIAKSTKISIMKYKSDPSQYAVTTADSASNIVTQRGVKTNNNPNKGSKINTFSPGSSKNNVNMSDIDTSSLSNLRGGAYLSSDFPFGYDVVQASSSQIFNVNFQDPGWATYGSSNGGSSRVCSLRTWANQHSITWDGVTNYNKC